MSITGTRHSNHFNCISVQLATCSYSLSMAQVLIIGILSLVLLQLAAGQTPSAACTDAHTALSVNGASCTTTESICSGQCRQYYDDVINNCDEAVSQVAVLCSCLCACLVINYMSIVS